MGSNIRVNAVTIVTLAVAALLTGTAGQSCPSDLCEDHTLCIYDGTGEECGEVVSRGLTDDEKQAAVDAHNKLRNYVASGEETRGNPGPQPGAANMLKLEWDEDLAVVAQRWADQCTLGHDTCRDDARFAAVGQNAYQYWTTGTVGGVNWDSAVQAWYDEVDDFDNSYVDSYVFGDDWGHYSAVVWAKTRSVGCGSIQYKKEDRNYVLQVCNYGPSGNYEGQPVYKTGDSCSDCPDGCDSEYTSLCA